VSRPLAAIEEVGVEVAGRTGLKEAACRKEESDASRSWRRGMLRGGGARPQEHGERRTTLTGHAH
jgi:hypothetical protein